MTTLIGLATTALGVAGYRRLLGDLSSAYPFGRFAAAICGGIGLVAAGLIPDAGADGTRGPLAIALGLIGAIGLGSGLLFVFVRPPAWARPRWQDEVDEAQQESRWP